MSKQAEDKFARLLQRARKAIEKGDNVKADLLSMQAMALAAEQMSKEEPSEDLKLKAKAHEHENAGDWEAAEACYRKCIELLAPKSDPMQTWKAHSDLAGLLSHLGRENEALAESNIALDAAMQDELPIVQMIALRSHAAHLRGAKRFDEAAELAGRILALAGDEHIFSLNRAQSLILRAR